MGNAQAELPLSKLSFLEKQMPPQKPGEFGYDVVSSSKLYQRLLSDLEAGRKNSVISYLEKKGYARGELREIFGKVREGGAASEFACIALIYGLGAYLGVEKIVSDAKLAESRGDQMKNFFLYTDERTVKGVNGAFLQNLLLNALRESKIEPGLKVTKEAYDEFSLDKGHFLRQVSFYIDIVGKSELLEKDKPRYVSQLEYLKGRIGGMGPKDWEDMEGAFGQAERVHSQFLERVRSKSGEPAPESLRGIEVSAHEEPLFGLESLGEGKPSYAVLAKLGVLLHGEDGELRFNMDNSIYKRAIADFDKRYPESRGILADDIASGRMSGRHKYFLSKVAEHAAVGPGVESWLPGEEGGRLSKIVKQGKLYSQEVMVDGKRMPAILALSKILKGTRAAPVEHGKEFPALTGEMKKTASEQEPSAAETPAKPAAEEEVKPVTRIETKPRELPQTERRELPVQQLGRIAPGEKEEELSAEATAALDFVNSLGNQELDGKIGALPADAKERILSLLNQNLEKLVEVAGEDALKNVMPVDIDIEIGDIVSKNNIRVDWKVTVE